ncbi:MAG: 1-acyl-sn-glycerol-3-phosphate acyltransferase [Defluviitaleaceae bacterium]|nr:1-acyl-sn-glycerol-3-phosphate acyltransferase [Defluviitaleaceae bacterium]
MRTIYFYIHLVVAALATAPKLLLAEKKKKTMSRNELAEWAYGVIHDFSEKQMKLAGAKIEIIGVENIPQDRAVLFVSNHQGIFDIPMFLGPIPTPKGCIAKEELIRVPILSHWMLVCNCIFMNREDIRKAAKSILEGVELLKSGYSMVIFPEGTRSKNNVTADFKAGSFKLATKAKVPIIPVTMDGTYKIMEANWGFIKPAGLRVVIHPAIETKNLDREEEKALPEKVRDIICSAITN